MADPRSTRALVLEVVAALEAQGLTTFTRQQLISGARTQDPKRRLDTIGPTIHMLTVGGGAGGAPVLIRVGRAEYSRADGATPVQTLAKSKGTRIRLLSKAELEARVSTLVADFAECVLNFDDKPAFRRPEQLVTHVAAIRRLREAGSVAAAIADDGFIIAVQDVLAKWGLNQRASHLVEQDVFQRSLQDHVAELTELEKVQLEAVPEREVPSMTARVYGLVSNLRVVRSKAKVVAGTKALHHLLPELVPPMDRAWTGSFMGFAQADWQEQQDLIFRTGFATAAAVARRARPSQYVGGNAWRTSATKVLDNALVGWCRRNGVGPTSAAEAAGVGIGTDG